MMYVLPTLIINQKNKNVNKKNIPTEKRTRNIMSSKKHTRAFSVC